MVECLAKDKIIEEYDLSSIQFLFCSGDFLRVETREMVRQRLQRDIISLYGMTETTGLLLSGLPSAKPGVFGRLLPGATVKVGFAQLLSD